MTVCIAAMYANGAGVVLASDKMTTASFGMTYEFERDDIEKVIQLGDKLSVYCLVAGDVLFANEVADEVRWPQ